MPYERKNVTLSGTTISENIYCDWWYVWQYNGVYYRDLPFSYNMLVTLSSTDGLYYTSAYTTSLGYQAWFKNGTTFKSELYHDNKIIGSSMQTLWNNNESCNGTRIYTQSQIYFNFKDIIRNGDAVQEYNTSNGKFIYLYHKNCVSDSATSGECISADIRIAQTTYAPVTFNNLFANETYYLYYGIGFSSAELTGVIEYKNVQPGSNSYTQNIPYSYVRLSKYFRDRTTNNSINGNYATLKLERIQNDGYDQTYTFNGNDDWSARGIRTGLYKISLISNIPGKPQEFYNYEKPALITDNFSMTNYINTKTLVTNIYLYNSDESICNKSNLIINIYHNNFTYASINYTNITTGRTQLTLFNIPFLLKILNNNDEIQSIKAIYNKAPSDSSKSSISFNNNTLSIDSQEQSISYHIILN